MENGKLKEGFWMVRVVRGGPFVASRIWLCDHEPGEPENIMDRPYWQGQIGLDLTSPLKIWTMLEYVEASPEQQRAFASPPLSERAPRGGRSPAFTYAPMPLWQQSRARRITLEEYLTELAWLAWAKRNAPDHPDFTYRRPVNPRTAPVPRFT
jgi:hypothetical protein